MRIKEVIKERGLTVAEVAKRMGVVPQALSRVINGNPTVEMIERVASALDVSVTELFERPTAGNFTCPNCGAVLEVDLKVKR
jgi:transcriptional regulator with XRE-family HTH domain